MNTDIRLSVGFWQHPKTRKTAKRLGLEGVRALQILWLWAAVNRPDGSLSGMDWEDIELAADWQGEEHAFFDVCLGMWIDQTEEGYVLHEWREYNPWQSEADVRSEAARKAANARWGNAGASKAQSNADAQSMPKQCAGNAGVSKAHALGNAPSPSPKPKKEENTPTTQESLVNQDRACALNVAGGVRDDFAPDPVQFDQPCIEFVDLREYWDRECRAEGPLTGWKEFKQCKAAHKWPGISRISQDVEARIGGGHWAKGKIVSLSRYLNERFWEATPTQAVPRASPRAPTEHQRRLTEREERARRLLEARGMTQGGTGHDHAGIDCPEAIDVEHRVRDIAL